MSLRGIELMLRMRRFEERLIQLSAEKAFPGHYHVYIGQEATGAAALGQARPEDLVFTTHRSHGHLIARGADPHRLFAEILGKRTGYCGGRGGTLHIAVPELGVPATSGLVAGGIAHATGAALAARRAGDGRIVFCFFGDGCFEEGVTYEALNLAALWSLPVLFVCENNSVPLEQRSTKGYPSSAHAGARLADVTESFAIPSVAVDGSDLQALERAFEEHVEDVRAGGGPRFVETRTTRWPGSEPLWPTLPAGPTKVEWLTGDEQPPPAVADWVLDSDPLRVAFVQGSASGPLTAGLLAEMDRVVGAEIASAAARAVADPYPDPASYDAGVFAGRAAVPIAEGA